ncbi:MAG: M14 family zinc carboxypeptidase, partial [bacterium]|nr:M14 family zinc carboxypeptidase [bacterium]
MAIYLILWFIAIPDRYHTYNEVDSELQVITQTYPAITHLDTIGFSATDSLPIFALKISDNPNSEEDEPAVLYNGVHHAGELLGVEICMYMINDLVSKYAIDSTIKKWIDSTKIWVVPIVNPDGHNIVTSGIDTIWRRNTRDNNNNGQFDMVDGVDLNRNYDFLWETAGSSDSSSKNYRGPSPFSENETRAIKKLTDKENFVFDICYHSANISASEVVYYPWKWGSNFSPDHFVISGIAKNIAQSIVNEAGNGTYVFGWGNAESGGMARNWFYGKKGTISFTTEVGESSTPPAEKVDTIAARNLPGAYYLLDRVHGSGITGCITDSITDEPLIAEVRILEAYSESLAPRMSDSLYGRYRRILTPDKYTVQAIKTGYDTTRIDSVEVVDNLPTILNIKLHKLSIEETSITDLGVFKIYPNPVIGKAEIKFFFP